MPPKPTVAGNSGGRGGSATAVTAETNAGVPKDSNSASSNADSNTVPTSSRRLDSIARASSSVRGSRSTTTPRPKFTGRRSQAARAELEQAEAKKKAAEAAESNTAKRDARKFEHGRGRAGAWGRGRGRGGGHMGDSHRREEPVASGPFGGGQVTTDSSMRRSGWGSGSGGFGTTGSSGAFGGGVVASAISSRSGGVGGSSRPNAPVTSSGVKLEPGMPTNTTGSATSEWGGEISSDDEDDAAAGPKQDIDRMQIVDLTGTEDQQTQNFMAPVRLMRIPHEERIVGAGGNDDDVSDGNDEAAENSSEKTKNKLKRKDVEVISTSKTLRRPTAYSSSDSEGETRIKKEPTENDQPARPSTPTFVPIDDTPIDAPSSPESKRKAKAKIKTAEDTGDADDFQLPAEPKFQTHAEQVEWRSKYLDLWQIRDELGLIASKTALPLTDAEGDVDMSQQTPGIEQAKRQQRTREEYTYLFQFPPVLPDLLPVSFKEDHETNNDAHTDEDAMDVDRQPTTNAHPEKQTSQQVQTKSSEVQTGPLKLPSGSVGKLRVHKSGKATLDWGGTSLLLGKGSDASFLQKILLADIPQSNPETNRTDEATTKSGPGDPEIAVGTDLGAIRGKFVLTPNWEEILK